MMSGEGFDPSNLHLKKELTQIRKAARVLRDPGTSSTWRSPINSARSLTKHHYVHYSGDGVGLESSNGYGVGNVKGSVSGKEKDKRVFLYNWRSHKSESERSRQNGEDYVENGRGEGSSSTVEESVDGDSLSDARNHGGNDTKSDTYLSDSRYASAIFNCKDTDFTPPIRRAIRKKTKRSNYSSASLKNHHNHKLQKKMVSSRGGKEVANGSPGLGPARDELLDHSDDTEDYCNSEDLRRATAISPLLARFKNKGWGNSPSKLLRSYRKEDDSISYSTPALSTSSYNKYGRRNPSVVESWDATTGSFNDADDEVEDPLDLPGRQGCGIPCYWSRRSTPKSRMGYGSSPSLSDTLRRKGSSILCGSGSMYQRRRYSSIGSNKRRLSARAAGQSLIPLLTSGRGSSIGSGISDDELSTNFGELDMEALSRLDGRRWSASCRSQEGLELVAMNGEESSPENVRSLSRKYRPMFFEEVIGQNIVIQSLSSAVSRGRTAPVYLFQGPRGTGKTSTARIFGAALNCLATEDNKPCGVCRECADFISGKMKHLREVDGSNKKGIDKIKNLLKDLSAVHLSANPEYKVFIIDECQLLPSKTWVTFLRLLEKPLPRVVFVLITTDIDNVPRALLSRCQKHIFNKISNGDIVTRLRSLASEENFDVESDALELIASNADGSLRDAETMLDQLSLFGKRITVSLVNELIGVVSDDKLLDLLELAMSSNATETVIKARELMDSGVDPIVLMSQMANLIVDIIAGTYPGADGNPHDYPFFGGRRLSEREVDRLKHALTLLSEAEKHLRVSSERSTWFTATLLQLGSVPSPDRTHSGSSRRQSSKATEDDHISMSREASGQKQRIDAQFTPEKSVSPATFPMSAHRNSNINEKPVSLPEYATSDSNRDRTHSKILLDIWQQCIEKCHSKTLRQLLQSHGKLVSISEMKGGFVAHIAFADGNIKTRAEGFLSSITNSFEIVLRRNVEVKIVLLPDSSATQMDKVMENRSKRSNVSGGLDPSHDPLSLTKEKLNVLDNHQRDSLQSVNGNANVSTSKEQKPGVPVQRIESIIREQRLETAWLQAMEKGTPGSLSRLKPERNQVLPNELDSVNSQEGASQNWEDELNREIKALKINGEADQKDQIAKRANHYPISPSLLHNSNFGGNFSKDNLGYESGSGASGCNALFCWNSSRPPRPGKGNKPVTPVRGALKTGKFSWFGECGKPRKTENRYQR